MKVIALLLAISAVAVMSQEPVKYKHIHYPTPVNHKKVEKYPEAEAPLMPFSFDYAVQHDPSGNDYSHAQKSDGKVVTGSYRVLLPDGRTQIVNYKADQNGYVADVKYSGEANYPDNKSSYAPKYPKSNYPK